MTVVLLQVKVAEWSDETRFLPVAAKFTRLRNNVDFERNKTYIMTTILEEPYIIERKGENNEKFEGNDRYEGYCKDLAEMVSKKLGITCKCCRIIDSTLILIDLTFQMKFKLSRTENTAQIIQM
jgi:glutamate receptor, ionotropic, invertebrate